MRPIVLWLAAVLPATSLPAQSYCGPQRADTGHVALTGVTLWDGTGSAPRPGTTVLLHGERIVAVFADGSREFPPATTVRAMPRKYMIPGLIDAHVHIATEPSAEDTRERTELRLCRALLGGITAVRDMAGDVRELASLQRDARVADVASPDIFYSALWAGPAFFADPRTWTAGAGETPGTLPWLRAIDSTTDLRQAVAEARGTGATAIKLYAELTPALVAANTAEAHRQRLMVWAHAAMARVSPRQTVEASVDVISHASLMLRELGPSGFRALRQASGSDADRLLADSRFDSLFAAMRRHRTIYEPTLFIYRGEREGALPAAVAITQRAHRSGVVIVAGTDSLGSGDTGPWQFPNLQEELKLLVQDVGLSSGEALTAATRTGAQVLGVLEERGTVEAGKLADLLVLDADPLADIANVATIRWVVKRGGIYAGGPTIAQ